MIIDFLLDLLGILFLALTAVFCFSWVRLRNDLPWRGRRSVVLVVKTLAILLGAWHALYALLKLVYLIVWTVTT